MVARERHPVEPPVRDPPRRPCHQGPAQRLPVAVAGHAQDPVGIVDLVPKGRRPRHPGAGPLAVAAEGPHPQADATGTGGRLQGGQAAGEGGGGQAAPQAGGRVPPAVPPVVEAVEVEVGAGGGGDGGQALHLPDDRPFPHPPGGAQVVPVVGQHRQPVGLGTDPVEVVPEGAGAQHRRGRDHRGGAEGDCVRQGAAAAAGGGQVLRPRVLDAGEQAGTEDGLAQPGHARVGGNGLAGRREPADVEAVPGLQLHPVEAAAADDLDPLAHHPGGAVGGHHHAGRHRPGRGLGGQPPGQAGAAGRGLGRTVEDEIVAGQGHAVDHQGQVVAGKGQLAAGKAQGHGAHRARLRARTRCRLRGRTRCRLRARERPDLEHPGHRPGIDRHPVRRRRHPAPAAAPSAASTISSTAGRASSRARRRVSWLRARARLWPGLSIRKYRSPSRWSVRKRREAS